MIHYWRALAARLRGLFGDRRADRELDDEIETHLRLLAERYVRQGVRETEATQDYDPQRLVYVTGIFEATGAKGGTGARGDIRRHRLHSLEGGVEDF
jgi:hypothetical protein